MSKAFTKEDDGDTAVQLDDLPQSQHPNLVTPSGLADLNNRLEARRAELEALRAKTEDVNVKQAIAVAERDIRYLVGRVGRADLVDLTNRSPDIVSFGAEVDVVGENDVTQTLRIVGEDEADPAKGLISPYSPLGKALLGAEIGSVVDWPKPTGVVELEVAAIRFE